MEGMPTSDGHALTLICSVCPSLESLWVSGGLEPWALDAMGRCRELRGIDLNYVEGSSSRFALAARNWCRLRTAELGRYFCDDAILEAMGSACPELEALVCDRCAGV